MQFILRKSLFHVFFMEFVFWEELFVTLHFLSWFILSYVIFYDIFVFFYFIQKKYIFIKLFFTINVPINYPPLSKIIQNLSIFSKSVPKKSEKSRKNPKNPEKIRFFHFFSYGLVALLAKSRYTIHHMKLRKKCLKKKSKKKWFSFLQTFFLKSILDIFLCPISKLKKKFWKVEDFPFFDLF